MRIEVVLTEELFRRFTVFDLFRRRKVWKGPAIWAAILCACGGICLYMGHVRGASVLGFVLMLVGIGLPLSHFGNFAASMKRQILAMGLKRPKHVYTLVLTDKAKGIAVSNDREQADYEWKIVHHVYRDVLATYLYITKERAFILPHTCLEEDADGLWALIEKKVPAGRRTDLRK